MQTFTGFHAVEEKLKAASGDKTAAASMQIFYSTPGPRVKKILEQAKTFGVKCSSVGKRDLDNLVASLPPVARDHRGIVLQIQGESKKANNIVEFDSWLEEFKSNNAADCANGSENTPSQKATVLVLDSITDPHNVGAILRSADQFGVSLVIMPSRRGANDVSENEIIARSSAGASNWVKVSVVANLVRAVQQLKEAGFWVYGADAGGTQIQDGTFAQNSVLIMGSEGSGIARLLREECDAIVSIPTCGRIDSLNVSVATGVLLYEIYRQRQSK